MDENNISQQEQTMLQQISERNAMYIEGLKERVKVEYNALRKINDSAAETGAHIQALINDLCVFLASRTKDQPLSAANLADGYLRSMMAIIHGGIISNITGDDDEWKDITVEGDVGQKFTIQFRGKTIEIPIESVEVNMRYPKIYRLNHDNRLAHRIDYMQFHDVNNSENVHLTPDSIRFIQFPYEMDTYHGFAKIQEGAITEYIPHFENEDIENGYIYCLSDHLNPENIIVAPKVPFYMLEDDFDIDYMAELAAARKQAAEELEMNEATEVEDDNFEEYGEDTTADEQGEVVPYNESDSDSSAE